eukprot:NODE_15_length_4148_cov_70.573489_g14_i0.p4 GENE.NODE_15_length_4148_cov_70.573489_g14_i0~~NODE_15_length_4148_cov_70.573489_g14_i0.p4  ORF type:complete len:106 (+),score=8.66 NODE_15_length_4148_cov_70.573489_g14_i0:3208-3525(+)
MFSIPFELDRSIVVNKPVSEVFEALGDFNNWPIWSPWIIQEPDCTTKVSNDPLSIGHQQEWDGNRIGSGKMVLIEKNRRPKAGLRSIFFLRLGKAIQKLSLSWKR